MAGHELTNNDIKQGQETNQIRKHEVGTHDTRQRTDSYSTLQLKFIYLKCTKCQHHFECVITNMFKIHDIQVSIENTFNIF